jgi:rare lipoprotein A
VRALTLKVFFAFLVSVTFIGCGRHKAASVPMPAPPPLSTGDDQVSISSHGGQSRTPGDLTQPNGIKLPGDNAETFNVSPDGKPLLVETGIASWYGAPYHNRRGSDGKLYNMNAMTAAHRTLPLGSIVRVTNLKTAQSALVLITDRGPFIQGRILDLSLAAADKVGVVRPGIAQVRMEVLEVPRPLNTGGRWAVQIGGFDVKESATKVADQVSRRYHSARVLSFSSPVGDWWVRVRVENDDRSRAQEIARDMHTAQGAVFLVRLD